MITGTVRPGALSFASLVGVLAAGSALAAQPSAPDGLREEVEARYRAVATRGGIGLLPRDAGRGVALIELRGEAVYIDGDGPVSVRRLTEDLGAAAAALLRLRRLDLAGQRAALGLPAPAAAAAAGPGGPAVAPDGSADDAAGAEAGGAAALAAQGTAAAAGTAAQVGAADDRTAPQGGAVDNRTAAQGGAAAAGTAVQGGAANDDGVAAQGGAAEDEAASQGGAAEDEAAFQAAIVDYAQALVAQGSAADDEAAAPGGAADAGRVAEAAAVQPAAQSSSAAPERRTVRRNIVRFGDDVHVPADERLVGDVTLFGGDLQMDGEVTGDITVIGGDAVFGPEAVARRDVTIVGGRVSRHPDARFDRSLNEVGVNGLDLGLGGLDLDGGSWFGWPRPGLFRPPFRRMSDLMETFLRLAFLGLLGSVVLLVASGHARRVADRVTAEPLKAGVVGLLAQLLFLPLLIVGSVVLVITLIGIPLLALVPVVVVGALVVLLLGFTGVAQLVSRLLARGRQSDLVLFWVGLVLLMTPALFGDALGLIGGPFRLFALVLGVTGFVVEYLAWTAGSGAVILNWFGGTPAPAAAGSLPPPAPPAVPPAPPASLPQ